MTNIRELSTGDILLLKNSDPNKSWFITLYDTLINYFTQSPYTHTAMVLKDPTWIRDDLKGLYVYESGIEPLPDEEDGKQKFGVQLTSLDTVLSVGNPEVYVRYLEKGQELITTEILKQVHDETHNTLYDFFPQNLLRAAFHVQPDKNYQHTNAMFCSALVSFMCVRFNFLPQKTDWSEVSPADLSSNQTSNFIQFLDTVQYSEDILYSNPKLN